MAPTVEDDWSDSDDDLASEMETSVLLGVPDGSISVPSDIADAAVSRIGGLPAFLPSSEPALLCSHCKICEQPMELLVQIWCPVEDSPHDRALYIWGCARGLCQRKNGSVRAWRGMRFNEEYAIKLQKQLARKKAQAQKRAQALVEAERRKNAPNPFSMQDTLAPNPFSLGSQIFGNSWAPAATHAETVESEDSDARSENSCKSPTEFLITAMASTTLEASPWISAPSYPPMYLSTTTEYIPPLPKAKILAGTQVEESDDGDLKGGSWALEAYENSLEIDQVFDRFSKRVGYEGQQCIRYELNGLPLPFGSDTVLDTLFPLPVTAPLPVTKGEFKVVPAQKRTYNPIDLAKCLSCKSRRVFECQLMPNLINVLTKSDDADKKMTDEQRRRAVEQALKNSNDADARGMSWGTCIIFSCENNCCVDDTGEFEARECWKEELVLIQWDV